MQHRNSSLLVLVLSLFWTFGRNASSTKACSSQTVCSRSLAPTNVCDPHPASPCLALALLAGPYKLKQGYFGAIGRYPIFLPYPAGYAGPKDETIYTSPNSIYRDPAYGPIGDFTNYPHAYAPFDCAMRCYNRWEVQRVIGG